MSRLKQFTLNWYDAWHMYDMGISSILVRGEEKVQIDFVVNGEKFSMDISESEDDFIEQLEKCRIKETDDWSYYNYWVVDGNAWSLRISYDNVEICSKGSNAYPAQFLHLMSFLHEKGLPKAVLELGAENNKGIEKVKLDEKWRLSILP